MSAARFRESWRDLLYAVNRRPEDNWRAQAAHHGTRVAVVALLALGLPLLFARGVEAPGQLNVDDVASVDVIADFTVALPKPEEDLRREREQAARSVLPVFRYDAAAADSSTRRVGGFLTELGAAFDAEGGASGPEVDRVLASYDVSLGTAQLEYLRSAANRRNLLDRLGRAYRELLPEGVVAPTALGGVERLTLFDARQDEARTVRADSLATVGEFVEDAFDFAPADIQGFRTFQILVLAFAVPSIRTDRTSYLEAQDSARLAVDSTMGEIGEGERIITAHERVTRADLDRLEAYNRAVESRRESFAARSGRYAGRVLYAVLVLGLVGATLFLYREEWYRELRHFLIIMGLVGGTVAAAALVEPFTLPTEFVPVVMLALVIGAVYDGLYALVTVLAATFLLMGMTSVLPLLDAVPLALAGSVAAIGVRRVRRRRQSWALIAGITAACAAGALAVSLVAGFSLGSLLGTVLWGFVGATLYTVLTLGGVVPLLERITGISTAQTLLELSDLNAPLLRELSLKAPGTYAHSINIANLAEAACEAIGADSLLARAGAYYHDIGKMVNPQYFVENQPKGRNPHDRLPPLRSAAIIRDHVRDGVRLASENRLPPRIHDFIREHHGTGLIRFFYDKAAEEAGEGAADVNPADFAYLGPKPQTRESAIIMMADGIESATRVLGDPTPERIRATIQAIADARLAEGQLDQCPLTLREIDRSKAAFARVLIGMYHRRIDYPSGVRSRDESDESSAEPLEPRSAPRRRAPRAGPEDQLEAALEAADAADAEASVRAADE